mmetsp:Transcript_113573/g.260679  ORF Transcript_113573/g.260679 Transcript_113573/m.260679 type:complete len:295 (-) Transcript_113573:43-927(-)
MTVLRKTLQFALKIFSVVPLPQLPVVSPELVHHAAPLGGRPGVDLLGPAHHVLVGGYLKELRSFIQPPQHQLPVPWPDCHISDSVLIASNVLPRSQLLVQHIQLPLGLHCEPVHCVLDFHRGVGIEVAEATAEVGGAAHLPEDPVQDLCLVLLRVERIVELLRDIHENGRRLEHPSRRGGAVIHHAGDLAVGVALDETTGELVTIHDGSRPSVVLKLRVHVAELLQEHGDLHPVGSGHGVDLQVVVPLLQRLLLLSPGRGLVDARELALRWGRLPDLGRGVLSELLGHGCKGII